MAIPKTQEYINFKQDLMMNYNQKAMEQEWARYKYWVMSKSHQAYNQLRENFKNNPKIDVAEFYRYIEELKQKDYSMKDEVNALQHCWGYFKKIASDQEKKQFLDQIESLKANLIMPDVIQNQLYQLAQKYEIQYLLEGYYLRKD